jgi:hypothetical protein
MKGGLRVADFADIGDPNAPVGSPAWCKYAHGNLREHKYRTKSEIGSFKYQMLAFRKEKRWRQLVDSKGKPFRTWEAYLKHPEPNGLGMTPRAAQAVMSADDKDLVEDVLGPREIGIPGGEAGPGRGHKTVGNTNRLSAGGSTVDYILARLDRDGFDELASAVRAETMSANAAAIEAGFRKKPTSLEQILKLLDELTDDEQRQVKTRLRV